MFIFMILQHDTESQVVSVSVQWKVLMSTYL